MTLSASPCGVKSFMLQHLLCNNRDKSLVTAASTLEINEGSCIINSFEEIALDICMFKLQIVFHKHFHSAL